MHTRDYVKSVFANEGLHKVKSAKMEAFLKSIDDEPAECWPEFIARFREEHYELFDQVVPPLLFGKDRLVRTILLRAMDPGQDKEMTLARRFVKQADGTQNERELLELVAKKNKTLNRDILKTKNLPKTVLSQIDVAEKLAAIAPKTKRAGKKKPGAKKARTTGSAKAPKARE